MQIARCYRADYQAVGRANWQIYNPNLISPNSIVSVPNIGSNGTIYGHVAESKTLNKFI